MVNKLLNNLLFSLFWAGSILTTKLAINSGLNPIIFYLQTNVITVVLLVPYILIFFKKDLKKIKNKEIKMFSLLGLILCLANIISNQSLKLTSSINYGFLIKTTVIFTPLLSSIFLTEKITQKKVFFMLLFFFGAFLISTNGKLIVPKIGDLLVITSALLFSAGVIITKKLAGKLNPELAGALRPIASFLFVLILIPLLAGFQNLNSIFNASSFKYVFATATFVVLLSIYLGKSVGSSTASYFTLMNNMTSIFVLLGGLIFLSESLSAIQLIGALITIGSAIMVQKSDI